LIDRDPEPSDDDFDAVDPRSAVNFALPDAQVSQVDVVGGEVVMGPPSCPMPAIEQGCTRTLKRLRIAINRFFVELDVAPEIEVDHAVVSVEAPLSVSSPAGLGYVVPVGTQVHTCATIDGKAWHDTRALARELFIGRQPSGGVNVDGPLPMALRASNAQCSPVTLTGDVLAAYDRSSPAGDAGSE